MNRAMFVSGAVAGLASLHVPCADAAEPFGAEERRGDGRLGVCAIAVGTGRRIERRAHERFPLASTYKLPLAMLVLARVDRGEERLDRAVPFSRGDIIAYSPTLATMPHGGRITIARLCAAAIEQSDNTAANLLLRAVGGPAALTAYLRRIGDRTTRVDREEPSVNVTVPGDARDTTTPSAVADVLAKLVLEPLLAPRSKAMLFGWMRGATTGLARLRAGVPHGWIVGDKTGTTDSAANDIAILWPPHGAPIVLAVYFAEVRAADAARDAAIASVARDVIRKLRD